MEKVIYEIVRLIGLFHVEHPYLQEP
jgi:hypothetical protein